MIFENIKFHNKYEFCAHCHEKVTIYVLKDGKYLFSSPKCKVKILFEFPNKHAVEFALDIPVALREKILQQASSKDTVKACFYGYLTTVFWGLAS